jgi:hypothetical protein
MPVADLIRLHSLSDASHDRGLEILRKEPSLSFRLGVFRANLGNHARVKTLGFS